MMANNKNIDYKNVNCSKCNPKETESIFFIGRELCYDCFMELNKENALLSTIKKEHYKNYNVIVIGEMGKGKGFKITNPSRI